MTRFSTYLRRKLTLRRVKGLETSGAKSLPQQRILHSSAMSGWLLFPEMGAVPVDCRVPTSAVSCAGVPRDSNRTLLSASVICWFHTTMDIMWPDVRWEPNTLSMAVCVILRR